MNPNVSVLSSLFEESLQNKSIPLHFKIIGYGGNGVVLRPITNELRAYCIKTVFNNYLKEIVLEKNKEKVSDIYYEYLKDNLGNLSNLQGEITNYRKILSNPSLKKYIPDLYYPNDNESENRYMILEYIKGTYFNIEGSLKINDKELLLIIEEFNKQGFEFGDKIEGIKKDDGSIIIIDLDSVTTKR